MTKTEFLPHFEADLERHLLVFEDCSRLTCRNSRLFAVEHVPSRIDKKKE